MGWLRKLPPSSCTNTNSPPHHCDQLRWTGLGGLGLWFRTWMMEWLSCVVCLLPSVWCSPWFSAGRRGSARPLPHGPPWRTKNWWVSWRRGLSSQLAPHPCLQPAFYSPTWPHPISHLQIGPTQALCGEPWSRVKFSLCRFGLFPVSNRANWSETSTLSLRLGHHPPRSLLWKKLRCINRFRGPSEPRPLRGVKVDYRAVWEPLQHLCVPETCRRWSTPSPAPRPTTSRCGRPPRPPTATSARGCCGASPARACAAPSAGSNVTRSARTCSTPTACRESQNRSLVQSMFQFWENCNIPVDTTLLPCGSPTWTNYGPLLLSVKSSDWLRDWQHAVAPGFMRPIVFPSLTTTFFYSAVRICSVSSARIFTVALRCEILLRLEKSVWTFLPLSLSQ